MITDELMNSLACTVCRGNLSLENDHLHCSTCDAYFGIHNGIPSFMESSEKPLFEEERFWRWKSEKSVKSCEQYAEEYPYKEFEEPILSICQGKVLEVGCGSGRVLEKVKKLQNVQWLTGLDPSDAFLSKGSEKGFELVQGIGEKMPYKDNYFDSVICVLYTIQFTEREKSFNEIYRVIKPGGYFAFDFLNYYQVVAQEIWYTIRSHKVWNWRKDLKTKAKVQYWHLDLKNINSELKSLKRAGFEISKIMSTKFIPFKRKYHSINGFWQGRLSTFFGRNVIVICKKPEDN